MTDAAQPILYSFRRCPYAIRARLAPAACGQICEQRELPLRDKPAALLAASSKGTVPVLVLPGDEVIDESLSIMLWARDRHDPQHWLGQPGANLDNKQSEPYRAMRRAVQAAPGRLQICKSRCRGERLRRTKNQRLLY